MEENEIEREREKKRCRARAGYLRDSVGSEAAKPSRSKPSLHQSSLPSIGFSAMISIRDLLPANQVITSIDSISWQYPFLDDNTDHTTPSQ